uniref:hypothetical protein n=1 Tax=uncultured Sphingomonas sp. TaxID=158754 RepID=UPI0035C9441D
MSVEILDGFSRNGGEMTLEEYRRGGRSAYADFVAAIRSVLEAAVKVHNVVPHAITGRAKQAGSLEKKLADRGVDPASAIEEEIKDLAGTRIVFLTNAQVDGFHNTGILRENFEILSVNVHHPVPGTETETRLFDSTNYLVQLKPERLALPEYAPFAGLKAEIQVQTLLNHAWAEMGHDTIYKQPDLKHVGNQRLDAIKDRMDKVMREYLLPAGHDFDKIARDFSRLMEADESFDPMVEILTSSTDNNALSEGIGKLNDLILPQVDDRTGEFLKLVPLLVAAVERSRGTAAAPVESVFGTYPGRGGDDIASSVAQLFGDHLYSDPKVTFSTLVQLYKNAATDTERKTWIELATRFSKHDLAIWEKYGPAVPQLVLDAMGTLAPAAIAAAHGVLAAMLGNILAAELGGTTQNAMTVTIHHAAVPVSELLRTQRGAAIGYLEQMLDAAGDDFARREILTALRKAATTPYQGGNEDLMRMVMEDGARVLAIETARICAWGLELRRWCEVDALHTHYRFSGLAPHLSANAETAAAQAQIVAAVLALRDALNADPEYVLYKTLVGHGSVRPDAWEAHPFDPDATNAWRAASFPAIVAQITDATVEAWISKVRRYIAEPKTTGGELMPLGDCMMLLGERSPRVAERFLYEMDEPLSPVLVSILLGIDRTSDAAISQDHFTQWVAQGRFFSRLAAYLRCQEPFDIEALLSASVRAIEVSDLEGVLGLVNVTAQRYALMPDPRLIDDVFMPAIDLITRLKKSEWINEAWGLHRGELFAALDERQSRLLMQSFVEVPEIEYPADALLTAVAERFPRLVLEFFEQRCKRERGKRGDPFDAIPFQLHQLKGPFAREPALLLDAARRWHAHSPGHHEFRGGRLIGNVFPTLSIEIAVPLAEIVRTGGEDDLAFVLTTLLAYDGNAAIYPVCMDVVDRLEPGNPLLQRLSHVFSKTGVAMGEFGFVEAEGAHRARLEQWVDDPRPKVQAYARDQLREVLQSMAWQQRRAVRDVEQRRRDWGEV